MSEHSHAHSHSRTAKRKENENRRFIREVLYVAGSALVFAAVWILSKKVDMPYPWLMTALFLVPYLMLGAEVLLKAGEKLLHGELLDEDFLMSVASIGAILLGDYPEAVAVMLFYRIGECFESYAIGKSRRSIYSLMDLRPDYACIESFGNVVKVNPDKVVLGSVIIVSPGERIPLDGIVTEGESSVDCSAITGESMPKAASPGTEVYSGCINLSGLLKIRVTSVYKDSTVSRILALVEDAVSQKSRQESLITRFAKYYTPIVVGIALILGIVPPLFGEEWVLWLKRALIFLVISCPCALVISVPLSFWGGIGCASKHGILIKGSNYIEALSRLSTVVMDKTGTVTEGSFTVVDTVPVGISSEDLLSLAASAECFSSHPIAVSLKNACRSLPDSSLVSSVREFAGRGIEARVCGKRVLVGNASFMLENGISPKEADTHSSVVHVAADGYYGGYIVIDDRIKKGAKDAVSELYSLGITKTVMLTGDSDTKGQAVARALKVDSVYTELLPSDKEIAVRELMEEQKPSTLAFIGDGINDAPVLSRANVGIAMGALGADAAIEAADIVLMDDDIAKLPLAIKIARKTVGIARQNIIFPLAVKFGIMILAAVGAVGMGAAVFADVGVLILASANAMRALRY